MAEFCGELGIERVQVTPLFLEAIKARVLDIVNMLDEVVFPVQVLSGNHVGEILSGD
jgi:hypothetical protein